MKKGLVLLMMISNLLIFSQEKKENFKHFIGAHGGIQLDGNSWPTFSLEYGQSLTGSLRWAVGFNYLRYSGVNLMEEQLIHSTDTFRVKRDIRQYNKLFLLGGEINYSMFRYLRFGAGITVGYNQDRLAFYDIGEIYDTTEGEWVAQTGIIRDYYPDLFQRTTDIASPSIGQFHGVLGTVHYLVIGLSFNTGVSIPIGRHFEITSTYNGFISRNIFLSDKSVIDELNLVGLDHYEGINTFNTTTSSFNRYNHSVTLGLRYKFN
ncbi:MAG: hypothetical protein R2780_14180 [Crocinitomicaceae bacterium]